MFTQQDVDQNPDEFIRKVLQGNLDCLKSYTVLANWILAGPGTDLADLRSNIQYDFHCLFGEYLTDESVNQMLSDLRQQLGRMSLKEPDTSLEDDQSLKSQLAKIKPNQTNKVTEMLEAIRNDSRRTTQ
jgi:hypothetical protein